MAVDFATNSGDEAEIRDGRTDAWYVLTMRGGSLDNGVCKA